jgi:hypothetical protein
MLAQRGIRIINNVIATNCLIHQQNLCSQVLSMNHVMLVYIFSKELDSESVDENNNNSFCLLQIIQQSLFHNNN